ncbi:hypothetical protein D3C80_2063570 [compost metagenome]
MNSISKVAVLAFSDTQVTNCDVISVPPTVPVRPMALKSESADENGPVPRLSAPVL